MLVTDVMVTSFAVKSEPSVMATEALKASCEACVLKSATVMLSND